MTDWSQYFPDEPAPRPDKNFADHKWEDMPWGRVCTGCQLRWADALGEGSAGCYGIKHNNRTQTQMEAERDWLWKTIDDAASS
jgi:hypothetical protein